MGRHTRPHDPAAATAARLLRLEQARTAERAEAADPARWGVDAAALALPAQAHVAAVRDGRGRVAHAHRTDVFERLHGRGGLSDGQLAAVRRLAQDMGLRAGLFRAAPDLVKVDAQAKTDGATQRMLDAGRRVDAALATSGLGSARLLRALIEPAAGGAPEVAWREAVGRATGEENPHAQAALVRAACENLAMAYRAVDQRHRAK